MSSSDRLAGYSRALALVLLGGCTQQNPWFMLGGAEAGPGSTGVDDPGTGGDGTSTQGADEGTDEGTDEGGDESESTAAIEPTTGAATGATSTGDAGGDSSTSSSSGGETGDSSGGPGSVSLAATIATCVLLKTNQELYGGPEQCEKIASSQAGKPGGVMILDTSVFAGGGDNRPAHVLFRFDVPGELAGLELAAVTLRAQVDDSIYAGGFSAGTLYLSDSFDDASLALGAPFMGAPQAASADMPWPAVTVSWSLDPQLLVAGQPLHLRLVPLSNNGVLLRSNAAVPGFRPRLDIDHL